ncbi:MAG: FAD-dependent monooxygenase [Bryobacteraceae bacterium]
MPKVLSADSRGGSRIAGVQARSPNGTAEIRANLIVGSDGRHSTTRNAAGLEMIEFGVPIDVRWFRIRRNLEDPDQLLGNVNYGRALILINWGDYFQAGLIIPKGSFEEMKQNGLSAFRNSIRQIEPYLGDRVEKLQDWDQIKLLTVQLNRPRRWYRPGLLCIGDAAHAMSPAGGVGINLAIQDAVATANLLAGPLREGLVTEALLERVQRRREFPTRVTQRLQANIHKLFTRIFQNTEAVKAPWQFKVILPIPGVQHLVARGVGMGIRPEHIGKPPRRLQTMVVYAGVAVAIPAVAFHIVRRGQTRATTFASAKRSTARPA